MRHKTVMSAVGALMLPLSLVALATGPAEAGITGPPCFGQAITQQATSGDDVLTGSDAVDVWSLLAGADQSDPMGGRDRICGMADNDYVAGDQGRDFLSGGPGADLVSGDGAIAGADFDDLLLGGKGPDALVGDGGDDEMRGGPGDDSLDYIGGDQFQAGADRIFAGGGADLIDQHNDGSVDLIDCGADRDVVYADRRDRVRNDCEVVRFRAPDDMVNRARFQAYGH